MVTSLQPFGDWFAAFYVTISIKYVYLRHSFLIFLDRARQNMGKACSLSNSFFVMYRVVEFEKFSLLNIFA